MRIQTTSEFVNGKHIYYARDVDGGDPAEGGSPDEAVGALIRHEWLGEPNKVIVISGIDYRHVGCDDDEPQSDAEPRIARCKTCDCYIDLNLGQFSPGTTAGRSGTEDDPRAPGDRDDICDVCGYK